MGSEQDTFDKLRRSSYNDACLAYTLAFMSLPSYATSEHKIAASEDALRVLGWTYRSLLEEDMRMRSIL